MENFDNQNISPLEPPKQQNTLSNLSWLKTLSIGFSIVSFGIAIGIGGYVLGTKKNQAVSQNQQIASPTPLPAANPIINWKTYTDSKLGFSIKYPPEITILRSFPEGGVEFVKLQDSTKDFREINLLSIYFRGIAGSSPENTFKDGECGKPCNENTKNVHINNAVGITTLGPNYPNPDNYYVTNESETAPVVRVLILNNPSDSDKDLKPFQKMISTFKFTDSVSSPTCRPRPACLDTKPKCMLETADMCPPDVKK